eukprot:6194465-Pleurochrysis_carterae.AAC.1
MSAACFRAQPALHASEHSSTGSAIGCSTAFNLCVAGVPRSGQFERKSQPEKLERIGWNAAKIWREHCEDWALGRTLRPRAREAAAAARAARCTRRAGPRSAPSSLRRTQGDGGIGAAAAAGGGGGGGGPGGG